MINENWFYRGSEDVKVLENVEDFPENTVGFVYKITNIDNNKYYIGKKSLFHYQNKVLGKKERIKLISEIEGRGRRPEKKKVIKESDWKTYYGSSINVKTDIIKIGKEKFMREILRFCFSKKALTYWECYYQFINNVLVDENCYNDNILEKFFRKDELVF